MKLALADLVPGQSVRVTGLDGADIVRRRLLELGLVPGTAVEFVRRAPMGDPIEVRLRGYHLSLRLDEARRVKIA